MPQINKSSDYFNTKLYTGNSSTQSITGVNFQPDLVWIKERTNTSSHNMRDIIRGTDKYISSDTTGAETTNTHLTSFDSDGFTLASSGGINNSGDTYVSWNFLASNTTASNTDGSITSNVSASTTSGFSIVSFTGTGSDATVGHGLNVAPDMVIVKSRDAARNWGVYHRSLGGDDSLKLNLTDATTTTLDCWNDLDPTSTVVHLGTTGGTNVSGEDAIMYCFHSVKGFSKFGSYTGNGSADGTFVYTGFKPAFVIVKRTDAVQSWYLLDNKRNTFNPEDKYFKVDASSAEDTLSFFDFLSNGFKARGTGIGFNASGGSYIYMAFAESPLVGTNNTPATAR